MADTNTYQAQANELSQKLWAIANELRGQMDASEFKNYILGVIFYRYLSERTEMYMAEILENDGVTYEEAFADDDYRPVVEAGLYQSWDMSSSRKICSVTSFAKLQNLRMMLISSAWKILKKQSMIL